MKKNIPLTVEEDLKSIDKIELENQISKTKINHKRRKIIMISTGIVLILLFTSLILLQGSLFHVVAGQIESRSVNNNVLALRDFNIIFSDEAFSIIQKSYKDNPKVETSLCLIGAKDNANYIIETAYTPVIYEQSYRHVSHAPCNNDTIIMFHTHPYKSCIASTTDLNTLKRNQLNNPDMLTVVMCEPNRFSVYK